MTAISWWVASLFPVIRLSSVLGPSAGSSSRLNAATNALNPVSESASRQQLGTPFQSRRSVRYFGDGTM